MMLIAKLIAGNTRYIYFIMVWKLCDCDRNASINDYNKNDADNKIYDNYTIYNRSNELMALLKLWKAVTAGT